MIDNKTTKELVDDIMKNNERLEKLHDQAIESKDRIIKNLKTIMEIRLRTLEELLAKFKRTYGDASTPYRELKKVIDKWKQ
jgi:hypothetical protein